MLPIADVWALARARLDDANALYEAGRYAGAIYLSGYAVELALKARICRTLGWDGWPHTNSEFENIKSLKTHHLLTLVRFSAVDISIKADSTLLSAWSTVAAWDPEIRYKVPDKDAREPDARDMVASAEILLEYLQR